MTSKAYQELKEKRGRPTETVFLHVRHDLDRKLVDLERELQEAEYEDRKPGNKGMAAYVPQAPKVAERIRELEDEAKRDAIPITFEEIGRKAWRDLEEKHPPTDEEIAEFRENVPEDQKSQKPRWSESFAPVAMAACCVEPKGLTAKDFQQMREDFGEGEFERLWMGCMAANLRQRELPSSRRASAVLSSTPRLGSQREPE